MKRCINCNELRPDYQFNLRRKGGTARRSECKFCHAKRERERKAGKVPAKPVLQPTGKTKHCTGCGEEKDLIYFDKNARSKHGLHSRCKQCRSARNAAYILQQSGTKEERGQEEWLHAKAPAVPVKKTLPPVVRPGVIPPE